MRTQILRAIGGTSAALALTTVPAYAGTAGTAGSAAEAGVFACGWDPELNGAYYNHCDSDFYVIIRVERHHELSGYDLCVGPGRTYLGRNSIIRYAWYKGVLC